MAELKVDAQNLLHLLESQDLDVVTEIEALIKENLQSSRESWLLNGLVDSYMVSQSKRCMQILATVQEPHDKHLMDRIVEHIKGTVKGSPANRLPALTLFAYIVRKQPPWLYQVARHSLMTTITKTLKTDNDVPVLMCGVLIIASITPVIPVAITQHLHDIFEAFSRLVAFNIKKPGNVPDVYLLHLQVGVYALFHRLWGMYPCNFLTYLRSIYSKPENRQVFEDLIKPMLERVRMHPLLVTASKDKELAMERWRHKEVHDIMVECAKMSLDPIEGWSEESLGPVLSQLPRIPPVVPEMGALPPQTSTDNASIPAALMPVAEVVTEPLPPALAAQDPLWSPSSVCGLSTPPPITPGGTPSTVPTTTEFPQLTGPLTPLPCLSSHVDSPLPHDDQAERRRLAQLNTHLAVQMQQTNGEASSSHCQASVPPSPLKPDFTSEPPFHIQSMRAIRKINFDGGMTEPMSQISGPRNLGSIIRQRSDDKSTDVTPAEEAVEDISTAIAEKVKSEAALKPASGTAETVSPSIVDDKPHVPASSSVPSVLQLPQFIDSLDVGGQTSQDKLEDVDQEVSALTQTEIEEEDDSTSGSDTGIPSHLPANVQMTAESVAAFMRQVNRIRFNSMNVAQDNKSTNKDKQYSRSNSCPNLKDTELDEVTEDLHHDDENQEQSLQSKADTVQSDSSIPTNSTASDVPPAEVVMTQVTKVTTTIQTQTSIMSTGSESETKVTATAAVKQPEAPVQQETEAERFYRYLMGVLLPQPGNCEKCGAREEVGTAGEANRKNTQLSAPSKWTNTARTAVPMPSPGGVPIYTTMSPPEMLDRHIMLGSEIHAQGQARIPLTSQNDVSWTHFGGVPPADEVNILSGQLLLLHTQLMFERHKSELHAKRNRRLLGRTVKTAALEEQYAAMQDQLRLQENEIQNLSESLRLQQQVVGELRAANDKHTCDRQVLLKSHSEEVENLRQSKEVLQSELRAQKEENKQLCKDMKHVRALMFCLEQELDVVNSKVGHTDELQSEVTRLTKELLLMGELQQKYQQRLVAVTNSHNSKPETQFVLQSYKAELASVRLCLEQKNTLLDSTKARLAEAEDCIKQKELMLNEDKKLMDQLRAQHKGEIQALEEKYRAQKKIQLGLHAQILDLYGQVPSATQPDDAAEPSSLESRRKSDPFATKLLTQSERQLNTPEGSAEPAPSDGPPKSPKLDMTESGASFRPHSSSAFTSYQEQKLVESVSGQNS